MTNIKWYNDQSAKRAHDVIRENLKPLIQNVFPAYELSHCGFNVNEETEEVTIKLHLNKIGKVKVVDDRREIQRDLGYSRIGRNNI